jgi:pentatricopeptide repeat protein
MHLISSTRLLSSLVGACGRAGESKQALRLFRNMIDEGLSPDRVAYNALFSALRVAGEADAVSKCCPRVIAALYSLKLIHLPSPSLGL